MRPRMSPLRQVSGELTIGIVGPHDLVERIMLAGTSAAGQPRARPGAGPVRRLVAAAYRDEHEAADMVARLGPAIDACLFASQVPYEVARKAGTLSAPATFVPLAGSALYAALFRASRDGDRDLGRASIDVLSRADVEDAFAELGIAARRLHIREEPASPAVLASFHERLWRKQESSVAFTCLQSVANRLSAADVPVFTIRPTGSAIHWALQTAALLGGYRRLDDAQLAVIIVEIPTLRDSARRASPRQSREELRLTVQRFLVQEAQRLQATVSPVSDHGFLITATRGSLASVTDGFRVTALRRARAQRAGHHHRDGRGNGPDRARGGGARPRRDGPGPSRGAGPRVRSGPGGIPRWSRRRASRAPGRPAGPGPSIRCPGWPRSCPRRRPR